MTSIKQDFRVALRVHARSLGATVLVVLTLGLGIGGVSSVYTVIKGVLLAPLPYPDAHELVLLQETFGEDAISVSYPNFLDWRERSRSFRDLASYQYASFALQRDAEALRLRGYRANHELFRVLGVEPEMGRTFTAEEDAPGGAPVAVISHSLWLDGFGGEPDALGASVVLDGEAHTVVGVMPPGFDFRSGGEAWVPIGRLVPGSELEDRAAHPGLYVVGRLAAGVGPGDAEDEMAGIASELREAYPDVNGEAGIRLRTLRDAVVGGVEQPLFLAMAAAALLLLIACFSIGSLLQARNVERSREVAVRLALGSGRARLARQFLTESLLLALPGGLLGLAFASAVPALLDASALDGLPRMELVGVDPGVVAFAVALSLGLGVAVGLLPAAATRGGALHGDLREAAPGTGGGERGRRFRTTLLTGQVALSVLLLVGAGLLARSLEGLLEEDLGFEPRGVLTFRLDMPDERYGRPERALFVPQLIERLEGMPGVRAAGVVEPLPLSGRDRNQSVYVEDRPYSGPEDLTWIDYGPATAGYFEALRIPLLEGRSFESTDVGDPPVAIVSRSTAERFWPGRSAIGRTLVPGGRDSGNPPLTVVGVVGDVRHYGVRGPLPNQMYLPYRQLPLGATVVVRTDNGDPLALVPGVRAVVAELGPGVAIHGLATLSRLFDRSIADTRSLAWAVAFFGSFALLLTLLGVYGTVTRSVAQRTHEMAVRVALGAGRGSLLGTILRGVLVRVAGGLVVGIVGAALTSRLLESFLYGVGPADIATYVAVAGIFTVTAFVAALVPSLRALRLEPSRALRAE